MRNIKDIIQGINIGIAIGLALSDNKKNTIELYNEIMKRSLIDTKEIEKNYSNLVRGHAKIDFENNKYNNAVLQYLDAFKLSPLTPEEYRNIGLCLIELNQLDAAKEFFNLYETSSDNKLFAIKDIGKIYLNKLQDYKTSIEYFERFISLFKKDDEVYNILGHLYSLVYKDKKLEQQKQYFLAAHNLKKNTRLYIRNLIFTLFRLGEYKEVEKLYKKLLNLNPNHSDYYYYGCFLVNQKNFKEGYKYLQHRFEKEGDDKSIIPAVLDKNKYWRGENLTGKSILVHCEQGFGDTIMYSRFVKDLSKKAKKVYFVVQDELFELMNNSNLGAEVYSTNFELCKLSYDYFTTPVDLPLYLDINPSDLPYKNGWLKTNSQITLKPNKKLKIGLCWHGNTKSKESARDIEFNELLPLFDITDTEYYSLQYAENPLPDSRLIDMTTDFKTFNNTAELINNLDLVISTDNVILNLAGALGKKCLGLFNKYPEYRWFDIEDGKPTNWYNSITVFQNKNQDEWSETITRLCKHINRLKEG